MEQNTPDETFNHGIRDESLAAPCDLPAEQQDTITTSGASSTNTYYKEREAPFGTYASSNAIYYASTNPNSIITPYREDQGAVFLDQEPPTFQQILFAVDERSTRQMGLPASLTSQVGQSIIKKAGVKNPRLVRHSLLHEGLKSREDRLLFQFGLRSEHCSWSSSNESEEEIFHLSRKRMMKRGKTCRNRFEHCFITCRAPPPTSASSSSEDNSFNLDYEVNIGSPSVNENEIVSASNSSCVASHDQHSLKDKQAGVQSCPRSEDMFGSRGHENFASIKDYIKTLEIKMEEIKLYHNIMKECCKTFPKLKIECPKTTNILYVTSNSILNATEEFIDIAKFLTQVRKESSDTSGEEDSDEDAYYDAETSHKNSQDELS